MHISLKLKYKLIDKEVIIIYNDNVVKITTTNQAIYSLETNQILFVPHKKLEKFVVKLKPDVYLWHVRKMKSKKPIFNEIMGYDDVKKTIDIIKSQGGGFIVDKNISLDDLEVN